MKKTILCLIARIVKIYYYYSNSNIALSMCISGYVRICTQWKI